MEKDVNKVDDFKRVENAIAAIKRGEFVVVMDDESRENEGDLVLAAEKITPEKMNFMIREARGLVCISLSKEETTRLNLPQMVTVNEESKRTRFTVSVDAKEVDTGISAHERALTVQKLVDDEFTAEDFVRPGHIFPIEVNPLGVLGRTGHTEASYDIVKLAGLKLGATFCEIVNDDGTMAREKDLILFSKKHNLQFIKIAELVEYRKNFDSKNN